MSSYPYLCAPKAYAPILVAFAHLGLMASNRLPGTGLPGLVGPLEEKMAVFCGLLTRFLAPYSVCTAAFCLCAFGMAGRHHLSGPGRTGDLVHFAAAGEPGQA